jgi:6-phosphogluconolactonase
MLMLPIVADPPPGWLDQSHTGGARSIGAGDDMTTLFIGTYTRNTGSEGIYRCDWDGASGRFGAPSLAVNADNPSFLIEHQGALFAVLESGDFDGQRQGAVAQYRFAGDRLEPVAVLGSGGADPCHLAVQGDCLAVANYAGASVALFALAGGPLSRRTALVEFEGRGPRRRQAGPHPHGVYFQGNELWVPDLGLDRIHRLDPVLAEPRGAWPVEPGSGPRQLAIDAAGRCYVLNELANRIDLVVRGAVVQSVSTLPDTSEAEGTVAGRESVASSAGSISLALDGRYVLASNRGRDSLACFPVDAGSGWLGPPTLQACDPHPRHFVVLGNQVIVASRDAGTLTAFELQSDGALGPAIAQVRCPAPVCVLAWQQP